MNKFDINKAMEDGSEEKEIIIKKCSNKEELLDEVARALSLMEARATDKKISETEERLKKAIISKSDDRVFEGICDTFKNVVEATGRDPEAGMCVLLDKEGNLNMSAINLETKDKIISFLHTLIEEVGKAYEKKDNL